MIKDQISDLERYKISREFNKLIVWVNAGMDEELLPDTIKAIHLEYETKKFDLSKFENHQRYIDVHYILEGEEYIGIQDTTNLKPVTEYMENDDYQLFEGAVDEKLILRKGNFIVLFTNEAHVTGGLIKQPQIVKKIVFKIPMLEK
ncbi:hypothetical protein A8B79_10375 [Balneola sp. EhC07]|uniref:YhcH/YjgK/YiaL family protein n=1 Tax=Balneola sp. EhC07 TaxID=1849360 RepID=UPI0007F4BCDA|nr:YhcH/YjgK/YiaL family protein [Balneola sp. EhC07]OAN60344.1 hypothetical protein A8B79_10375 [Balneola sp. EhC07]